jgi:hypothetical protein
MHLGRGLAVGRPGHFSPYLPYFAFDIALFRLHLHHSTLDDPKDVLHFMEFL